MPNVKLLPWDNTDIKYKNILSWKNRMLLQKPVRGTYNSNCGLSLFRLKIVPRLPGGMTMT